MEIDIPYGLEGCNSQGRFPFGCRLPFHLPLPFCIFARPEMTWLDAELVGDRLLNSLGTSVPLADHGH